MRARPIPSALTIAALFASVSAGCSKSDHRDAPSRSSTAATEPRPSPPADGAAAAKAPGGASGASGASVAVARAMRITIDTTLVVADLDAAVASVRATIERHAGYVGDAKSAGRDQARAASFEAHVPIAQLRSFRAEIAALGESVSDAEKAEDVTEQQADLGARLGNARAQEKRLHELLEKQSGSLADVLAIEREVASTRESIERMEAQQRVLNGEIALATMRIQLSTQPQPPPPPPPSGPLARIARAGRDGIDAAGSFVVGSFVVAASVGPTLSILLVGAFASWRIWRSLAARLRARQAAEAIDHAARAPRA